MAKSFHPLTLTRTIESKTESRDFNLNSKEYLLYKALEKANGAIVPTEDLMKDLEMTITHLRVTKRTLERLLEGWVEFMSVYKGGYSIRVKNTN